MVALLRLAAFDPSRRTALRPARAAAGWPALNLHARVGGGLPRDGEGHYPRIDQREM